jgi:hypothetical protein
MQTAATQPDLLFTEELPPILKSFETLWHAKRGTRELPTRADFSVDDLAPWIGRVHVLQVLRDDFKFLVFASMSMISVGFDWSGRKLSEVQPVDLAKRARPFYTEAVRRRRPVADVVPVVRTEMHVHLNRPRSFSHHRLALPLSSNGKDIDRIFGVLFYRLIE